jgi:deazaflavin-dependent oxidoreductase (nitroreductase family)
MSAKPPPQWMMSLNVAMLRRGLAIGSQYLLTVPGRRSGRPRSTPVSIAMVASERYIVAAFEDAAWVGNVRAAGTGTLSRGRRHEAVVLNEVAVDERGPSLRAFLEQVPGGVRFFDGRTPDAVVAAAPKYPVFRVSALPAGDAAARQV